MVWRAWRLACTLHGVPSDGPTGLLADILYRLVQRGGGRNAYEATHVGQCMTLVGQKAPDWTAPAVVGNDFTDYTLSENWKNGKTTVLWFYPLDFTFVCPTELLAFNARLDAFKERNTEVVSVSVDSKFTHLAWKNTAPAEGGVGEIQYPMVADVKKEITRAYGVEHPDGIAFRGLFIIDKTGVVRHVTINDLPLGRNVDEVLRMVDAIHYADTHGEVCPAGWTEGAEAMTPSNDGLKEYMQGQVVQVAK